MKVHGVSLHFYDPGVNSDKFYRAFVWATSNAPHMTQPHIWHAAYHWGRDGAPTGQTKEETYYSRADAEAAINKKVNEKIRKGYEFLGQGEIDIRDLSDVSSVGHILHQRVGRTPTKVGGGFSVIIQEEADLLELLTK